MRYYIAGKPVTEIEQGFWNRLYAHRWPGNVRELFHIFDYAVNVCEGGVLRECDLPPYFSGAQARREEYAAGLSAMRADYERKIIEGAFAACGRNLTKTAELLKLSRQNLQYYLKKYDIK